MPRPKDLLGERYFIKVVRADEQDYWRYEAIIGLTRSPANQRKFDLRKGGKAGKRKFTVIGNIYERATKAPTLSPDEKKDFSQHQSFSLVDEVKGVVPRGFGTTRKRGERLLGIAINKKDIRLNRLFRYDGGTYNRPYDFDTKDEAEQFLKDKVYGHAKHPKLFPPDKLEEFVESLKKNKQDQYNEPMAYARWNTDSTSFIIIASDNLESRLLAMDRSRILYGRLQEQAKEKGETLPPDYQVPIAFYLPNTDKHLQYYTPAEQAKDLATALAIINDPDKLREKMENEDYEILFAIDPHVVFSGALDKRIGINIIGDMIKNGRLNVFLSLFEKANQDTQNSFKIPLKYFNNVLVGYYKDFDLEFLLNDFLLSFEVNKEGEVDYYFVKKHPDPAMWPKQAVEINDDIFRLITNIVRVNHTPEYQKMVRDLSYLVKIALQSNNAATTNFVSDIILQQLDNNLPYQIGSGGSVFNYQELEAVIAVGNKEAIMKILAKDSNFCNQLIFARKGSIFHPEERPYTFTYPAILAFRNLQFEIMDQIIPRQSFFRPLGDFNENLLMHMIYELKFLKASSNKDAHSQATNYIIRILENFSSNDFSLLNIQKTNGKTVLHLLAENDPANIDLFKKLILAGGNPYIKDNTGKTALDALSQAKNPESRQLSHDLILLEQRIAKLTELASPGMSFSKLFNDSNAAVQELAFAKLLKKCILTGKGAENLKDVAPPDLKKPLSDIYSRYAPPDVNIEHGP